MNETELAEVVVDYLEDLGWEVYQEVSAGPGGSKRADIVGKKHSLTWIVEVKKSFGFSVLAQADEWIRDRAAHMVSVATPAPRRRGGDEGFRADMAKHVGCGWLLVSDPKRRYRHVEVKATPRLNRRLCSHHDIARFLHEEHKNGPKAGSKGGGYWTPFRATMEAVAHIVRSNPGIDMKGLIDRVDHHYSSDRSARHSIAHWIRSGRCPDVEGRKDGKTTRFFPSNGKATELVEMTQEEFDAIPEC